MRRFLLVTMICLTAAAPTFAWHDGGHKIVAAIAFRRLSPSERAAVFALLNHHPRFTEEFTDKMPDGLQGEAATEWSFQQAAVFPDIVRRYSGELHSEYHRPNWHFINAPEFLSPADRMALHPESTLNLSLDPPDELDHDSNVIQVIRVARRVVGDASRDASERALMLSWLFHTVGDIHQPLHSTALFSRGLFPDGDRGGNRISTVQKGNLHSLWDDFPGGRLTFSRVQREALGLLANSSLTNLGQQAAGELDEKIWLDESKDLSVNVVYDAEVMAVLRNMESEHTDIEHQPVDLSEDYLRAGADTCDKRVVQAGFRLGAILSQIFD